MKKWVHSSTESYPTPEWVLDNSAQESAYRYHLSDPDYGWATIAVYENPEGGSRIYKTTVQPDNKDKVTQTFRSFEMASRWAESKLYATVI